MDAVKAGLSDKHPYPRKAAAMGVLKIMDYAPEHVERAQLLHIVRILLMDDPAPEARAPTGPSFSRAHPSSLIILDSESTGRSGICASRAGLALPPTRCDDATRCASSASPPDPAACPLPPRRCPPTASPSSARPTASPPSPPSAPSTNSSTASRRALAPSEDRLARSRAARRRPNGAEPARSAPDAALSEPFTDLLRVEPVPGAGARDALQAAGRVRLAQPRPRLSPAPRGRRACAASRPTAQPPAPPPHHRPSNGASHRPAQLAARASDLQP